MSEQTNKSKRDFLKKSAYAVPVVLTLNAAPAIAGSGSPKKSRNKSKDSKNSKYSKSSKNSKGSKSSGRF